MDIEKPKIYRIKSEPSHFYTGHLKDRTQVFMGIDHPNVVAVLFDAEGQLLRSLTRTIPPEAIAASLKPIWELIGLEYTDDWKELYQWAAELGLVEGVIAVQKFNLPEFDLRIQNLPSIYQELLDSGEEIDEDTMELIQEWQEDHDYVLVWGNEYDMDSAGKVIST